MAIIVKKNPVRLVTMSGHSPQYPGADYWINPVLPNCDAKYWKNNNNALAEMNAGEKTAVDQAEQAQQEQQAEDAKDFSKSMDRLIKAFALVTLDEINALRSEAGLAERTMAQLKTAVKNKYDSIGD